MGANQLLPFLAELSQNTEYFVSAHPNAGLPNQLGEYEETAQEMANIVEQYLQRGLVNIVGGCCGTTPAHIALIAELALKYPPRIPAELPKRSRFSGLEPLELRPEINFLNIGERTNVAGSKKFARLIADEKYEEALSIAREQVEGGAQVIDVCMKAIDNFSPDYPTYLQRNFEQQMEIPQADVEKIFINFISSPTIKEMGKLISKRLGRPLQPFDIWYDGFKARGSMSGFWNPMDGNIYFQCEDAENQDLYKYQVATKQFSKVITKEENLLSITYSKDGKQATYAAQGTNSPTVAYLLNLTNGNNQQVASPNKWLSDVTLAKVESWNFTNKRGETIVGRVYYPPSFDITKKYPVIVYYYGGTSPVGRRWEGRYPFQYYAANGYLVYVLQPAGTTGFGQEFSAMHDRFFIL